MNWQELKAEVMAFIESLKEAFQPDQPALRPIPVERRRPDERRREEYRRY